MDRKQHWEHVYATKPLTDVSWYQPLPATSLTLIEASGGTAHAAIIDVGGGDSLLVDALLDRGDTQLTVLDLSGAALARAQARLGTRASAVTWIEADATHATLPAGSIDVWHDRAVFHFLTDAADRARYVAIAAATVRAGGALIVGTFALDGPSRCSGLPVAQYSPDTLAAEFATAFTFERGQHDTHITPPGAEQRFVFVVLRRHGATDLFADRATRSGNARPHVK